ncbi:histone H1-like [Heterodontus francisci]|uniref:histone H1-like n=1 Tax=Heterodontus francisci TaxID=7792 RepID=UPI00355C4FDB
MADNSQKVEDVGELSVDKALAKKKKQQPLRSPQRRKKQGPTVTQRILQVAAATKERRGISLAALKKALSAKGYDVSRNNTRVNRTVKQLVRNGSLVQTAGIGASGSFRFNRSKTRADTPAVGAVAPALSAAAAPPKDDAAAKKKASTVRATPTTSRKSAQPKSSAAKRKRAAGGTRRKAAAAKPRKAALARRKPKLVARRLGPKAGRGKAMRPYRKTKPLRGKKAGANAHRRRPPAARPKRPVGRPKKNPIPGGKTGNFHRR